MVERGAWQELCERFFAPVDNVARGAALVPFASGSIRHELLGHDALFKRLPRVKQQLQFGVRLD